MQQDNSPAAGAFQTAREAIDWIVGRMEKLGMKPGLARMQQLMARLGHPERRLKFIHVAGTNGKGSTCAFLTSVLRACGYDVGTFTSPYLEKYTNRIQVNGEDIDDDSLVRLVNELKPVIEELSAEEAYGPPTMFEITTALAILYFAKVGYPDYVVWETGLGGRLDCTNIVTPIVSIITNVGHDHMEILGDTLEQVAAEKAGIIKPGVPVITAVDHPGALEVVECIAKEKMATLYKLGGPYSYTPASREIDRQRLDFRGPFRELPDVEIALNGSHQLTNAAVAIMALEVLRQYYACIVEDEDLRRGLRETRWPGRLEMIAQQPRLLLDGAHNPEGAQTLAAALRDVYSYDKLHFMIGMLSTKNHPGYLRHILPLVDTLILTEADFHKKGDAGKLAELAQQLLKDMNLQADIVVERDWKRALALLTERTGPEDLAVISGTLYLISDVRSWIIKQTDSEKGW